MEGRKKTFKSHRNIQPSHDLQSPEFFPGAHRARSLSALPTNWHLSNNTVDCASISCTEKSWHRTSASLVSLSRVRPPLSSAVCQPFDHSLVFPRTTRRPSCPRSIPSSFATSTRLLPSNHSLPVVDLTSPMRGRNHQQQSLTRIHIRPFAALRQI